MTSGRRTTLSLLLASAAFASFGQGGSPAATTTQPEPVIMLIPIQVSNDALRSGCWVQIYDEREFNGDMVTLVGPLEFESFDKGSGRQLKQGIDSLVTGSKATLRVYEHQMFKDRTIEIGPDTREGSLLRRLGAGGSIQSLTLECDS